MCIILCKSFQYFFSWNLGAATQTQSFSENDLPYKLIGKEHLGYHANQPDHSCFLSGKGLTSFSGSNKHVNSCTQDNHLSFEFRSWNRYRDKARYRYRDKECYQWLCDLDQVSCSHLISNVVLRDLSLTEAMHPRTFHLFWCSGGFNTYGNVL